MIAGKVLTALVKGTTNFTLKGTHYSDSAHEPQNLASIRLLKGPQAGKTFDIVKPVIVIGRSSSNDIFITDLKVSRHHARIVYNDEVWSIECFSQTATIMVDQQRVEEKAVIQHNSTVDLGEDTSFLFLLPVHDEEINKTQTQFPPAPTEQSSPSASFVAPSLATEPMIPGELLAPLPSAVSSSDGAKRALTALQQPTGTEIASYTAMGIPSLEVTNNITGVSQVYAIAREVMSIGRESSNDIVIDDDLISDFHLQIVRQDNQWVLIHPHPKQPHTTNGLLYQGRTIRGDKAFRKSLMPGDVFRVGDEHGTLITLTYHDGSGAPQIAPTHVHPIPLQAAQITIGRLPDNDVVLPQPQVSGHHAQITPEANTYRLTDLNSTNHTYVNGIQVTSILLKPVDEIRIGPFKFIYTGTELTQYDESGSIRIDALHLKKVGNSKTVLINDISLSIPPRSFIALVGGSGAGKSTLLDALNGLRPAQEGSVFYNGQDYYHHFAAFKTQLGYVPQEDIMHRDLTVERALYYVAKLRLPRDFTQTQISERIDEVLEDVEMKHRRKLLIKKLSGGQRKRVSIALELLANPSVFFLDEPTSGLDPGLDRKTMVLLRKLADKGHTILLVTHATSNINVCDAVCFLTQGGRLAYFGPPEEAKTYFHQPDFAGIYTLLEPTEEHPDIPQEMEKRFRQSPEYQFSIEKPLSERPGQVQQGQQKKQRQVQAAKRGKPWKQFLILCQRYLELLWNDTWNLAILLLQAPIIGLIILILIRTLNEADIFKPPISLFNLGDAQKFLLILSFAALMFGCINSAREIIKEMPIYQRERTVNLGIIPYLFSKIIILGILCLLQCAILLGVMALGAHFYSGILLPSIWEIYITLALTSIAGVMVGLTISALVRNNDQAMSFVPLVLIPQLIFSGTLFTLKGYPLQIFGALFSLRWAMAALGSTVNLPQNGDNIFGTCSTCSTYQHNISYLLFTWLTLIATILLLGLLTGYILRRKDAGRS